MPKANFTTGSAKKSGVSEGVLASVIYLLLTVSNDWDDWDAQKANWPPI
jgi:hypothetical protein